MALIDEMPADDHPNTNLIGDGAFQEQVRVRKLPKLFYWMKTQITVEPLLFLSLFGSNMCGVLLTNLLMTRYCDFMGLPNCTSINIEPAGPNEKLVQPHVATLGMYKLIFESLVPAVLAFFIGPWSDKYGRRPLMLAPLLGYCLNFILLLGFVWFNLAPIFIILTSAPLVLLGGSMTFYTGAFCYITDVSPKEDLSFRLAVAEGMLYLGILCGNIAGPYIYNLVPSHGYEAVFGISFVLCLVALLYGVFFVPESITNTEDSIRERMKALFDHKAVDELFRVCFGYHDGYSRITRLILVAVSLLSLLSLEGIIAVSYLFIRTKFSWDVEQFSYYIDAVFMMNIGGLLFGTIVFSKFAKLPNEPLSCLGYFLKSIGYVICAIGNFGWYLYLGSAVGALGGMTSPLNRAIMTETVPKSDIGKLFSIVSAFTAAVPIVAGLIYTYLYNSTLNTFPGAVYLFSAALSAVCCVLLGTIVLIQQIHKATPHRLLEEDQDSEQPLS